HALARSARRKSLLRICPAASWRASSSTISPASAVAGAAARAWGSAWGARARVGLSTRSRRTGASLVGFDSRCCVPPMARGTLTRLAVRDHGDRGERDERLRLIGAVVELEVVLADVGDGAGEGVGVADADDRDGDGFALERGELLDEFRHGAGLPV